MTKFRLYFNKDKETAWLNEMAANGYALKGFFAGFYQFEECQKGEYIYQIDFGNKMFSVNEDYRMFMEENGIEIVCLWGYWIILRKHANEGDFVLYTDVDSSIEHYTKILKMFKIVTIIELLFFMLEAIGAALGSPVGLFGMFLLGILVIVLMHATFSTKKTINALKERTGETTTNNTTSPILLAGLCLNLCGISLNRTEISHSLVLVVQIAAIILMLIGIYQSRNVFRK